MEEQAQQEIVPEKVVESKKEKTLTSPQAILLGAFIIAVAIIVSGGNTITSQKNIGNEKADAVNLEVATKLEKVRPVSPTEHIRGNPNAPIKIVVYSDFECPYCRVYHETILRIFAEYGASGKVAWIHRQYPIDSLHANARRIAVASECVGEVAGNDAFWQFTDAIFATTKSNNTMNESAVKAVVATLGIDTAKWNTCMLSGKYDQKIADDVQNGVDSGGQGTPWSVIVSDNGKFPVPGALPYENVKSIVESTLKKK
jgi:protein-disulfide isomerase